MDQTWFYAVSAFTWKQQRDVLAENLKEDF